MNIDFPTKGFHSKWKYRICNPMILYFVFLPFITLGVNMMKIMNGGLQFGFKDGGQVIVPGIII